MAFETGWNRRRTAVHSTSSRAGPDWSLAQDGVYFASHQGEDAHIFFYRFSDRTTKSVGSPEKRFVPGKPSLSVSPDSKWLLYAQLDHVSNDIKIRSAKAESGNHQKFVSDSSRIAA